MILFKDVVMLTRAALSAALLNAHPGRTFTLAAGQECGPVLRRYKSLVNNPVMINANGSMIKGLTIGFRMVGALWRRPPALMAPALKVTQLYCAQV